MLGSLTIKDDNILRIFKNLVYLIPVLFASYFSILLLSRKSPLRKFEKFVASGLILFGISELIWVYYELSSKKGEVPFPSPADALFIAGYFLLILAASSLIRFDRHMITRNVRFVIDSLILIYGISILSFAFTIIPTFISNLEAGLIEKTFSIIYPTLDLILIVVLFLSTLTFRKSSFASGEKLFITGLLFTYVADLIYTRLNLSSGYNVMKITSVLPDVLWMLGYAFFALSVRIFMSGTEVEEVSAEYHVFERNKFFDTHAPIIFILLTQILFYFIFITRGKGESQILYASSVIVSLFAVVRTALLIYENRNLEKLATIDSLTGLYNRRQFQIHLEKELERVRRTATRLALAILDIDEFAFFNNTYGHKVGDEILKRIGMIFRKSLRKYDIAFRLGGDEFAILFMDCRVDEALILLERLRASFLKDELLGKYNITFSAGLAVYPEDAKSSEELIALSDHLLYKAKFEGKNQTAWYDHSTDDLSEYERQKIVREQEHIYTLKKLAVTLDAKDGYRKNHCFRVAKLASKLAAFIGFNDVYVKKIELAAFLMDIGRIVTPKGIYETPEMLKEKDLRLVKMHPVVTCQILENLGFAEIAKWVLHHHERWDGSGYPDGLKGEEIPLESRILTICDVYVSLTSDRPHRNRLTRKKALERIWEEKGKQFDPRLVDVFFKMLKKEEIFI